MDANIVHNFWFNELTPKDWFQGGDNIDQMITKKFESILLSAAKGELFRWRSSAKGRLAEILVLDQFSRNIYRDTIGAFSQDSMALILSQETISLGIDKELTDLEKSFLYMPFMHSESLLIHEEAIRLFSQPGLENNLDFEHKHKVIIERFGRYPHRNSILGRESSTEELEFLKEPNSSF